jgi:hypothetical protein
VNSDAVASTLVDQLRWNFYLERHESSRPQSDSGLPLLPDDHRRRVCPREVLDLDNQVAGFWIVRSGSISLMNLGLFMGQ